MSACVKSARAVGRLTFGAVHPAVAKTIRFDEGAGTSAPDQFQVHSTSPPRGVSCMLASFGRRTVEAFASFFRTSFVGGAMLPNVGGLDENGGETSSFQNAKRLGSALASGLCGMP